MKYAILALLLTGCATLGAVEDAIKENETEILEAVAEDIEDVTSTAAGALGHGPLGDAAAAALISIMGLNQYRNATRKRALNGHKRALSGNKTA